MLDRLRKFRSYIIIDIKNMIGVYKILYKQINILSYLANLLYRDLFFCNKIKNMSNRITCYGKRYLWVKKTIYIYRFEGNFQSLLLLMLLSTCSTKPVIALRYHLTQQKPTFLCCFELK